VAEVRANDAEGEDDDRSLCDFFSQPGGREKGLPGWRDFFDPLPAGAFSSLCPPGFAIECPGSANTLGGTSDEEALKLQIGAVRSSPGRIQHQLQIRVTARTTLEFPNRAMRKDRLADRKRQFIRRGKSFVMLRIQQGVERFTRDSFAAICRGGAFGSVDISTTKLQNVLGRSSAESEEIS
jgi:hypothetical protein